MKTWAVVLLAILAPGGAICACAIWWRGRSSHVVSEAWCQARERVDQTRGIDGVSIRWPINKLANERGTWNAAQLRKRA